MPSPAQPSPPIPSPNTCSLRPTRQTHLSAHLGHPAWGQGQAEAQGQRSISAARPQMATPCSPLSAQVLQHHPVALHPVAALLVPSTWVRLWLWLVLLAAKGGGCSGLQTWTGMQGPGWGSEAAARVLHRCASLSFGRAPLAMQQTCAAYII
eukprot:1150924-Pelagomonas_calceolata.AAC.4